ncbi:MAG: hypothetical protein WC294_06040 [Methanoregula sp.]|jgi:hypothetical protein
MSPNYFICKSFNVKLTREACAKRHKARIRNQRGRYSRGYDVCCNCAVGKKNAEGGGE